MEIAAFAMTHLKCKICIMQFCIQNIVCCKATLYLVFNYGSTELLFTSRLQLFTSVNFKWNRGRNLIKHTDYYYKKVDRQED